MKNLLVLFLIIAVVYSQAPCDIGQIKLNDLCTPLAFINGCTSYSTNGDCNSCQYGYSKDVDGTCVLNIPINNSLCCSQRDLYGNCQQCAVGLYLDNNRCKRNIQNGCVVKKDGSNCQACGKGFYLSNGQCRSTILGCESYNSNGACIKCTTNVANAYNSDYKFNLFNGICIKTKIIIYDVVNYVSHCKRKNAFGCVQCQDNYYLDENRECVASQLGCLSYFKGRCIQCSSYKGYSLDNLGRCINKYQNGTSNCIQYAQNSQVLKCLGCLIGFRLIDNVCVDETKLQIKIQKQCGKGYYLSSDYTCRLESGNLVKQGQQQISVIIKEPGCIYQYGQCQYCQSPFVKVDNKCTIPNCQQLQKKATKTTESYSCVSCRYPFVLDGSGNCLVPYCSKYVNNKCVLCQVGYHLKANENCVVNDVNCKSYDADGNCEQCADKYFISSSGECMLKQSNCLTQQNSTTSIPVCTSCVDGFFLNKYNQCQKIDPNCESYLNGNCRTCKVRYFLYDFICFPYTVGCVRYDGSACMQCKKGYTLFNKQCYGLQSLGMKLQGEDDNYNFDIYPLDITKSKYYIDNLSPVSTLGDFICSSSFSSQYLNPTLTFEDTYYNNQVKRANGWKSQTNEKGQYIGYKLKQGEDSLTFYALQLEFIEKNQISSFYLEYTKDGVTWIRVENRFVVSKFINSDSQSYQKDSGIITIYFTGIYAQSIRIVIDQYVGWPACKFEFFYYDLIRYKKIENLKSLKYLQEAIQTNFVDRRDNQLYINQQYFFNPQFQCHAGDGLTCFTGLQLCEPKTIRSIQLVNQCINSTGLLSYVSEYYIAFSQNGRSFECYNNCTRMQVQSNDLLNLNSGYPTYNVPISNLVAKNVRVYPTKWVGTPKLSIFFDYQ